MKKIHWAVAALFLCVGLSGCAISAGGKVQVGRVKQAQPTEQSPYNGYPLPPQR